MVKREEPNASLTFLWKGEPVLNAHKRDVRIRLAVVGGGFGSSHHWHEHPNCEVTAVADLEETPREQLVKSYNCPNAFVSLEEMLEKADERFDAVAIFTDVTSHAKHAVQCMERGKHVVSACPVGITLEEISNVKEVKERTGLTYMMHESSYYRQACIAARELYQAGEFGRIVLSEVEYYHTGIGGRKNCMERWRQLESWRYGFPPMLYATHSLGFLVGVTGERIVKVSCMGEHVDNGDFPAAGDNRYNNPFANEMALGYTNQGNICRFGGFWHIEADGERSQWLGEKMSCHMKSSNGQHETLKRTQQGLKDWNVPKYWETERLPEAMRHQSGHGGSSTFLCAEFVEALVEGREPTVDVYESIAMTVPGIVAHQSALRGGELLEVPSFDPA